MNLLNLIEEKYKKENIPDFNIGDTVKVGLYIVEGDKKRIQVFEGIVIAKKHSGINETFTVRKISAGIGVEKVFPLHSPSIAKIEVTRRGDVRRAKLYYLRERLGKKQTVKEKIIKKNNK